jgi:hypothetical protein
MQKLMGKLLFPLVIFLVLATLYIRSKLRHKVYIVRTYFLCPIANGEEIASSLDSSVTSCLAMSHCLTKNLPLSSSQTHLYSKWFPILQQGHLFAHVPLHKKRKLLSCAH